MPNNLILTYIDILTLNEILFHQHYLAKLVEQVKQDGKSVARPEAPWSAGIKRQIAVVPKEKFTAPTSGLEKSTFSQGTTRDAARFKNTLDKLAHNVGMWHVYGSENAVKAMKDMAEPVFMQSVRPPRKSSRTWSLSCSLYAASRIT